MSLGNPPAEAITTFEGLLTVTVFSSLNIFTPFSHEATGSPATMVATSFLWLHKALTIKSRGHRSRASISSSLRGLLSIFPSLAAGWVIIWWFLIIVDRPQTPGQRLFLPPA